ncbi:MAG: competence protein ComEC family protein [Saprospiraceae bacterium]|nr:competence protein ComEC family protein [Saprospiraceae bacterium]
MNWTLQPLLRPMFAWLFGMLFSIYFPIPAQLWLIFWLCALVCFIFFGRRKVSWIHPQVSGLFVLVQFFLSGAGIYQWRADQSLTWNDAIYQGNERSLELILKEELHTSAGPAYRGVVSYSGTLEPSFRFPVPDLLVRFGKGDSLARKYGLYDKLKIKGVVQNIRSTTNPEAFDYAAYLKNQNIGATLSVSPDCHTRIKREDAGIAYLYAQKVHKWMKKIMIKLIANPEVRAVNIALMTGDDSLIEDTLYQAYSATGAVHVLSVSGLHVAIFIGPFLWLTDLWKTRRFYFVVAKLLVLLSMIVFYLMITGLSPSVVRSGVMIAMVLVAKSFQRTLSSMHILSLSAFLMLVYDPYYIHQVSFLFSYLSLAGILFFEPQLSRLCQPSFWPLAQLWKLTTVSIAAQVFITPWAMWYFHQFSCSFILSGWIAVPIVTVIMYYSTVLLLLESVHAMLPTIFYHVWISLTQCMNSFILWLSGLPFSAISDIYVSEMSLWLMLMFQFFFVAGISGRAGWAWKGVGYCLILLVIAYHGHKWKQATDSGLIVYDIYKKTVVDIFSSGSGMTWTTHLQSDKSIRNASRNFRIKQGYTSDSNETDQTALMCLCSKLTLVVGTNASSVASKLTCDTDILIDTGQSELTPEVLISLFLPDTVILGGAVSFLRRRKWEALAGSNTFLLHHVNTRGAFWLTCSRAVNQPE